MRIGTADVLSCVCLTGLTRCVGARTGESSTTHNAKVSPTRSIKISAQLCTNFEMRAMYAHLYYTPREIKKFKILQILKCVQYTIISVRPCLHVTFLSPFLHF